MSRQLFHMILSSLIGAEYKKISVHCLIDWPPKDADDLPYRLAARLDRLSFKKWICQGDLFVQYNSRYESKMGTRTIPDSMATKDVLMFIQEEAVPIIYMNVFDHIFVSTKGKMIPIYRDMSGDSIRLNHYRHKNTDGDLLRSLVL